MGVKIDSHFAVFRLSAEIKVILREFLLKGTSKGMSYIFLGNGKNVIVA